MTSGHRDCVLTHSSSARQFRATDLGRGMRNTNKATQFHDVPRASTFHFILLYNHRALLRYIWARDPPIITKVHDFGTHRELCPNVTLVAIDCSDRGIVASAGAHAAEECSDAQYILSGVD